MARDGRLRTFNESPHAWERFDADIRFAAARAGRKAAVHITVREHNGQVPEPAEAGRAAPTPSVDFVEVHGSVRLRCLRGANNSVSNCQALSETPPGQGFGDLAVNYAQDGVIDTPTGPPGWIEFTASVRQDVAVNRPAPPRPVVQRLVPDGRVIVSCMVEPRGRMSQCHVLWQSPRNAGLGAIALAGAESGRMTLRHPVTTRQRVNINVPFGVNPPPSPPDSAWAPHPSQGATPGPIPLQLHGQGDADGAGANGGAVNLPPLAPRTQPRPPLGAPASDQTN
jgi:hypothetical protein